LGKQKFLRNTLIGVTMSCYDEFSKIKERENKMSVPNTAVFEYCIINFDKEGAPFIAVGPFVIAFIGEENSRDVALFRIGREHADIITDDSEVQIRPFC